MYARRFKLTLTTAADGTLTAYTPENVWGRVLSIVYVKDGTTPFSNGVDMTVTAEATGEAILTATDMNASAAYYPRVPVHDEAGAGATLDGTRKMRDAVVLADDRVKITIASGGDTKTGVVHVVIG